MAKRSSRVSKSSSKVVSQNESIGSKFVIHSHLKNMEAFLDFVKSLREPFNVVKGLVLIVVGMVLVAQTASRAKGVKQTDIMKLKSVNYYVRKLLSNNPYARLGIGSIVTWNSASKRTVYLMELSTPTNYLELVLIPLV